MVEKTRIEALSALRKIVMVTGSRHKTEELREVLPDLVQESIDLCEVQAIDSRDVIAAKLREARQHVRIGAIIVEDTALHLACLNGFPGALIKWLLSSVGCQGIYDICDRMGNCEAKARTVLGYLPEGTDAPLFFDDTLDGTICPPKGSHGFGWDPVFTPHGFRKTLAEMEEAELRSIKMRRKAAEKLAKHLDCCATSSDPP